jgi:hypothetical protein
MAARVAQGELPGAVWLVARGADVSADAVDSGSRLGSGARARRPFAAPVWVQVVRAPEDSVPSLTQGRVASVLARAAATPREGGTMTHRRIGIAAALALALFTGACSDGGGGSGLLAARVGYGAWANDVAVSDLDGDRNLDVLAYGGSSGEFSLLRGEANGTFAAPLLYATTGGAPMAGDLNGDARVDVATMGASMGVHLTTCR